MRKNKWKRRCVKKIQMKKPNWFFALSLSLSLSRFPMCRSIPLTTFLLLFRDFKGNSMSEFCVCAARE